VNLQRGFIAEGKDRQQPVIDPDAASFFAIEAATFSGGYATTWYATANNPFGFAPNWELSPPEVQPVVK
jgi:hypothetical protein